MSNTVNFTINFEGNAEAYTKNMIRATGELKGKFDALSGTFGKFKANLVVFQQASQLAQSFSETLKSTAEPGLKLNTSLHELSAITGVTGGKLKEIEGYARATAKTFGGSAAQSVEAYKLVLSQLSPEIAKVPAALSSMGASISTLSKTMGGNVAGATEVLTTAMNQFQVSTENPIAAADEMAKMMNVMAAAAQAGSAELPQIKAALEQSGMAAKGANVSFAETNAAIQVLDKAGKKASEGGVALRNVLATLAQGRFLPKDVQQELAAAGVSVGNLTNTSLSLADRLAALSPVAGDAALMTKLFGKENANAATALMSGIDQMREWTVAISETKSAEEQAAVIMQSREEQMARYRAKIDDLKISFFQLSGNILPISELVTSAMVPLSQMMPLILSLGGGIKYLGSTAIVKALKNGMVALGSYALSLVTTGTASTAFAATSAGAFATLKVSAIAACKAIGIAIMNIPVFGWIAAALAALGAAAVWAYNKFEGFRKVVLGVWEVMKGFGTTLKELFIETLKSILNGFSSLGSAIMNFFKGKWKEAAADAKKGFAELFKASPVGVVVKATVKTAGRVQGDYKKGAEKAILKEEKEDIQDIQAEINEIIAQTEGGGPVIKTVVDSEAIKQAKDLLAALPKKLEAIRLKNKILGDSETALKEQVDAVRSAIVNLTELGYGEQSKEMQGLISKYSGLREEQQKLIGTTQMQLRLNQIIIDQQKRLGKQNNPLKGAITAPSEKLEVSGKMQDDKKRRFALAEGNYKAFGNELEYINEKSSILKETISQMIEQGFNPAGAAVQKLVAEMDEYAKQAQVIQTTQEMIGSTTTECIGKMGQAVGQIGQAFAGLAGGWLQFASTLLSSIPQLITQFTAFIGACIAGNTAKQTSDAGAAITGAVAGANTMPWPLNIVAMGVSIAATLAALATSVPAFANGGIVSGPTMALVGEYAGASNNPEVIAPLNKLKALIQPEGFGGTVEFEIKGRKLIGLLSKENNRFNRTR